MSATACAQQFQWFVESTPKMTYCPDGSVLQLPGAQNSAQAIAVALNIFNTSCYRPKCTPPSNIPVAGTPTCIVGTTIHPNGPPSPQYNVTIPYTCTPPPAYDIKLLKTKSGTNFKITLINVGPPLVSPASITVVDQYPGGLTVTGGTGNANWSMSPGAGTSGPANVVLTCTLPNATTIPTNGTIGSYVINGIVDIKQNCATATVLKINGVVVTETSVANNSACAQ